MSVSLRRLFPLAILFAAGLFLVVHGGPASPDPAYANHNEEITVQVITTPSTQDVTFNFAISGCGAVFALKHNQSEARLCPTADGAVTNATIIVVPEATWLTQSITCGVRADQQGSTAGAQTTFDDTSAADNDIVVNIQDNEHILCIFTFAQSGAATPTGTVTGTATPTSAFRVTASAAPSTVDCNGSSFVIVVVTTIIGTKAPDGTVVTLTTTLGTLNPAQAPTTNGEILTIFTAPNNQSGTATITAKAADASATTSVTVNCSATPTITATNTPAATPTLPPLPTATAEATVSTVISPPSTGSGGLQNERLDWRVLLGSLLIAISVLGGLTVFRKAA